MPNNLSVEKLDFDGIKENLKQYIINSGKFTDIDVESSGISTIINLLSYNTHYIGYYVNMLMNEAFIDSAFLKNSLLSKAKLTGYIPKSKRSARATIKITALLSDLENYKLNNKLVSISQNTIFNTYNDNGDEKSFTNLDFQEFNFIERDGNNFKYESSNIVLYEGKLITSEFLVTNENLNRFVIRDTNIDIDTLKVYVKETPVAAKIEYSKVDNLFEVTSDSLVYYLTTSENGLYEVIFGNNIFGKGLLLNNVVILKFISTSGSSGNGSRLFTISTISPEPTHFSNFININIISIDKASGGLESENIDELKYNIPKYNSRQNRLITLSDYKSFLLSEFRDIESISIYGGEDSYPIEFGKINISIKPKNSPFLSYYAKEEILQKIKNISLIGSEIHFKDPSYLNIDLSITVKLITDNIKNKADTKSKIINIVNDYNKNTLNRFEVSYSDIDLASKIKLETQSVQTIFTSKTIYKSIDIIHENTNEIIIDFGSLNKIKPNTFYSDKLYYNNKYAYLKDIDGLIYLLDLNNNKLINKNIGSIDYNKSIIKLKPELSFRSDTKFISYDSYKFFIIPEAYDIFSYNDTLINISSLNVII